MTRWILAAAVLAAVAAALILFVRVWLRTRYSFPQYVLYLGGRAIVRYQWRA